MSKIASLRGLSGSLAIGGLSAALTLQLPVHAGSLSGTASLRGTIASPPDVVFEAVLIDIALADAPARELGRMRLQPAGQPPFRFTIAYRDAEITSQGRYTVRATLRSGERLLFTTDTITPVLSGDTGQPLQLQLVQVAGQHPVPSMVPLGRLPASWSGDLPTAAGTVRWQLDLAADGSFQLRRTLLDRLAPQRSDRIGRWRLEPAGPRLLLLGDQATPQLVFQPLAAGAVLQKLDPQGEPLRSRHPDRLQRLLSPQPIEPRLRLQGQFRYLADAASIRLCATGARLPVAMEADYRRLEQAYLEAQSPGRSGQPLLVDLEALISDRPSAEPGRGPQRTLLVERFLAVDPLRGCPQGGSSEAP